MQARLNAQNVVMLNGIQHLKAVMMEILMMKMVAPQLVFLKTTPLVQTLQMLNQHVFDVEEWPYKQEKSVMMKTTLIVMDVLEIACQLKLIGFVTLLFTLTNALDVVMEFLSI
jgi:hypothetical protein